MITKRAFIIGSGASIREGKWDISPNNLPLWSALKDELTIGINWCYKYFNPTVSLYGDYEFYITEKDALRKLPLVFGMQDPYFGRSLKVPDWNKLYHLENNIYLLPNRTEQTVDGVKTLYHGVDAWKYGFYSRYLSGILGLNLAIALGCTDIYLLGFDCNATDGRTHFYQDSFMASHKSESGTEVCGVGHKENGQYKTSVYNQNFNEKYEPFKKELNKINITNVSMNSGITIFPKMSYDEFYDNIAHMIQGKSQSELREEILNKYKGHYKC